MSARSNSLLRTAAVLAVLVSAALFAQGSSHRLSAATTINVTTTNDELNNNGNCSLREAIQAANTDAAVGACPAGSGADTINVPAGIYMLTIERIVGDDNLTGDFDVMSDVSIIGDGSANTIITQGCDTRCSVTDRVFHIYEASAPVNAVSITGVTISNGDTGEFAGGGAGIYAEIPGELTLSNSVVTGNRVGGGILSTDGELIVSNSIVSDNSGNGIVNGGISSNGPLILSNSAVRNNAGVGIFNYGTNTATLTNSTVEGNSGQFAGGILNYFGTVNATSVTIKGNNSSHGGGGITNDGVAVLANSTVEDNVASISSGGGVHNAGTLTVNNSAIRGNRSDFGAGIYNAFSATAGTAIVTDSTVSDNQAAIAGGGIFNDGGSIILTNSTMSGNAARGSSLAGGGGIRNEGGTATLIDSTVSGNSADSGGGIKTSSLVTTATTTLKNTIVASNPSGGDCAGTITSLGHNLSSDASCGFSGPGDMNSTDPLLGPLAINGGPTETHALLAGSPAIDAGSGDCPPPATDQRGVARPQDGNGDSSLICDIGAFELQASTSPTPQSVGGVSLDPQTGDEGFDPRLVVAGLAAASAAFAVGGGAAVRWRRRS